jgi:DNA ligase-1
VTPDNRSNPYKIKRLGLDISCTCPAWRNQKKFVDSRTCKHLKELLGDDYEDARIKLREEAEQEVANVKKNKKPASKRGKKRKQDDEDEDDEGGGDSPMSGGDPSDPLSTINGIAPTTYMADGSEKEIASQSRSILFISLSFY